MATLTYKGQTIRKYVAGYSYPRNGNVHNPTPRVRWLIEDGGSFALLREAKAAIDEVAKSLDLSTAYDGVSKHRQRRALKPLERDILVRIITDIFGEIRRSGSTDAVPVRLSQDEVRLLFSIREAIDPRRD